MIEKFLNANQFRRFYTPKKKGHFNNFVAPIPKNNDCFEAWFDFHFDDFFSHCKNNIIVLLVVYCWKK